MKTLADIPEKDREYLAKQAGQVIRVLQVLQRHLRQEPTLSVAAAVDGLATAKTEVDYIRLEIARPR